MAVDNIKFKNKRTITKLWKDNNLKFKNFRLFFNSTRVGYNIDDDPELSQWVSDQRILFKLSDLTKNEYDKLIDNGFEFKIKDYSDNELYYEYKSLLKKGDISLLSSDEFSYINKWLIKTKNNINSNIDLYDSSQENEKILEKYIKAKLISKENVKIRKNLYKWYKTYDYVNNIINSNKRIVKKDFPIEYRWIDYNSRNLDKLTKDQNLKFSKILKYFRDLIESEKLDNENKKKAKEKALIDNPTATQFIYNNCNKCGNNKYNLKGECTNCVFVRDKESKNKRKNENLLDFNAKVASHTAKRKAIKINATPNWLSEKDYKIIENFYKKSQELKELNNEEYHVDHIIPMVAKDYVLQDDGTYKYMHVACGLHTPNNLQILTELKNKEKQSRFDRNNHNELEHILESISKYNKTIGITTKTC